MKLIYAALLALLPTLVWAADNAPAVVQDTCTCTCRMFVGDNPIADLGSIVTKGRACRANENSESCSHPDFPGKTGRKVGCRNGSEASPATRLRPKARQPAGGLKLAPSK